jgi:hypothetical protein
MDKFFFCIIGFLIGYKFGTIQIEKFVKREVERQIATLYDWMMKDEN